MPRKAVLAVAVLVVAAAAAGAWFFLSGGRDGQAPAASGNYEITARDMTQGDPKAKVVWIEYAAPACPHCAYFNAEIMPALKKRYIDTGKVFYVFRVFPLFPADGLVEKLARCMPRARYFAFMDQIFRSQKQWDPEYGFTPDQVRAGLLQQARIAGMTEDQFNGCAAGTREEDAINQVAADGQSRYSIGGTPAMIVNGTPVGAGTVPTLEQMQGYLDAALANKPL